jgi:hypothetical protein
MIDVSNFGFTCMIFYLTLMAHRWIMIELHVLTQLLAETQPTK